MFNNRSTDSLSIQTRFGYCVCRCKCGSKGNVVEQAALIQIDMGGKNLQFGTPVVNYDFGK